MGEFYGAGIVVSVMRRIALALGVGLCGVATALADSTQARCESQPTDPTAAKTTMLCTFSQRQGFVSIQFANGRRIELTPVGDRPGNFVDNNGRAVYRQKGLDTDGLIFKLPDEEVRIIWQQ